MDSPCPRGFLFPGDSAHQTKRGRLEAGPWIFSNSAEATAPSKTGNRWWNSRAASRATARLKRSSLPTPPPWNEAWRLWWNSQGSSAGLLYKVRGSWLRFSISIILGVGAIKSFYAVENDSDNVIAPQIPGRFLEGFSGCFACPSYEQSTIGLCLQNKDFSNGGRGRRIDQNPTKGTRGKSFDQLRGKVRL